MTRPFLPFVARIRHDVWGGPFSARFLPSRGFLSGGKPQWSHSSPVFLLRLVSSQCAFLALSARLSMIGMILTFLAPPFLPLFFSAATRPLQA